MLSSRLDQLIKTYVDFPKKGILYRDVLPVLSDPKVYSELIDKMSSSSICKEADAVVAIDARGFLFGSGIALNLSKPMILARQPGKLPGNIISNSYELEYGSNSLSIQKDELSNHKKFVIIDDLLATGGTAECVSNILLSLEKIVLGLSVVIELSDLNGKGKFNFPVISQICY